MLASSYIIEKTDLINSHLKKMCSGWLETEPLASSLFEAAKYSLLAGGKRLRPLFLIATAESYGISIDQTINIACAVEMVHTYSLIHDDLPCMDDDDLRRGLPTLHKVFPESHAVLAGDFLLTKAFETIASAPFLGSEVKIELLKKLSTSIGGAGMIGGQILDIEGECKTLTVDQIKKIHELKTGALISASIVSGGIIASLSEEKLQLLHRFGENVGLAFQVIDDILDITLNEEELGKTAGSDLAKNKSTFPSLLGLESSKIYASNLYQEAHILLKDLNLSNTALSQLLEYCIFRNK